MLLENTADKIIGIAVSIYILMLSSTIMSYHGDMDEEDKNESSFGYSLGYFCLISSIIAIIGIIFLHIMQNR